MAHIFRFSAQQAEAADLCEFWGQPGLPGEFRDSQIDIDTVSKTNKNYLSLNGVYSCVRVCAFGAEPTDARGIEARGAGVTDGGCEPPDLVLGTKLQSSARATSAPNYQAFSPAPKLTFLLMNPRHLPLAGAQHRRWLQATSSSVLLKPKA